MNGDDVLKAAARALRDETRAPTPHAEATRARVLGKIEVQRRRQLFLVRTVVPIAALLVTGVAWGTASGRIPRGLLGSMPAWMVSPRAPAEGSQRTSPRPSVAAPQGVRAGENAPPANPARDPLPQLPAAAGSSPLEVVVTPRLEAPATSGGLPAPSQVVASEPVAVGGAAPGARPAVAVRSPVDTSAARAPAIVPAGEAKAPPVDGAASSAGAPAEIDGDRALYLVAHRLHFAEHDAPRALAAWEEYLRGMPRGRFAVEAAYNRALCLIRVGRTAEGRRALEPFAAGRFGSYRKAEATALLGALGVDR